MRPVRFQRASNACGDAGLLFRWSAPPAHLWPGFEDVNDTDRLGRGPAMRWMATSPRSLTFFGIWIDRVYDRNPPKLIVLDMDSSVSPTHGKQELRPMTAICRVRRWRERP